MKITARFQVLSVDPQGAGTLAVLFPFQGWGDLLRAHPWPSIQVLLTRDAGSRLKPGQVLQVEFSEIAGVTEG